MPIPNQYKSLVGSLAKATQAGRVVWRESPKSSEFIVSLKNSSIKIDRFYDDASERTCIDLTLINPAGQIAARFVVVQGEVGYEPMSTLYDLALGKARMIDETIGGIMEELESGEVIGEPPQAPPHEPVSESDIPF